MRLFLAALVLANHVVAAAVLLDGGPALGALLRVRRDPVGGLAVVVTLLCPLPDQGTSHRIVPVFCGSGKNRLMAWTKYL